MSAITLLQYQNYTDNITNLIDTRDTAREFIRNNVGADNVLTTLNLRFSYEVHLRRKCLKKIFDKAFEQNPEAIIDESKQLHANASFYPLYKRVCWIQAPKLVSGIFGNAIVKIVVIAASTLVLWNSATKALTAIETFTGRALPVIINNTPLIVIQAGNKLAGAFHWVMNNPWKICAITFIAQRALLLLPFECLNNFAESLSPLAILGAQYQGLFSFFLDQCFYPSFIWDSFDSISYFFRDIALTEAERERSQNKQIAIQILLDSDRQHNPQFYQEA